MQPKMQRREMILEPIGPLVNMATVSVAITLDERYPEYGLLNASLLSSDDWRSTMKFDVYIDIDSHLYAEYTIIKAKYDEIQHKLQNLYKTAKIKYESS